MGFCVFLNRLDTTTPATISKINIEGGVMKLLKVLSRINQIEKTSFLKILDSFCAESRKITPQVDQILTQSANQLKNVDDANIV